MELICNELSLYPLVGSAQEAESYFRNTLKTFESCKLRYGFTHIRFPINFKTQLITSKDVYLEWINKISNKTLKDIIISLFRPPFIDDLTEDELKDYVENKFKIIDEEIPSPNNPFGLPIAYILACPTISFNTHKYWHNNKINLQKINNLEIESFNFCVFNICFKEDLDKVDFIEWKETSMIHLIKSIENLIKYLAFTKYEVKITDDFWRQLSDWKEESMKLYKYILSLMKDVQLHPFTGGIGQTENLKNRGKEASKRITNSYPDGHRLSYTRVCKMNCVNIY